MPFSLGIAEMVFIFAILLLVFGAKRLPEIGSAMGSSIRDFKRSINGLDGRGALSEPEDRIPGGERRSAAPAEPAAEAKPDAARSE